MNGDINQPYRSPEPVSAGDWLGLLIADAGVLALVFGAVWLVTR